MRNHRTEVIHRAIEQCLAQVDELETKVCVDRSKLSIRVHFNDGRGSTPPSAHAYAHIRVSATGHARADDEQAARRNGSMVEA